MYCGIIVKEHVLFMIKIPMFSQQGFNMFQARSVLEIIYYLFRTLVMFSHFQ